MFFQSGQGSKPLFEINRVAFLHQLLWLINFCYVANFCCIGTLFQCAIYFTKFLVLFVLYNYEFDLPAYSNSNYFVDNSKSFVTKTLRPNSKSSNIGTNSPIYTWCNKYVDIYINVVSNNQQFVAQCDHDQFEYLRDRIVL
jgi:hypothetical protein